MLRTIREDCMLAIAGGSVAFVSVEGVLPRPRGEIGRSCAPSWTSASTMPSVAILVSSPSSVPGSPVTLCNSEIELRSGFELSVASAPRLPVASILFVSD